MGLHAEAMKSFDLRCPLCNRYLCKDFEGREVELKCHGCGTLTRVTLPTKFAKLTESVV